MIPRHPKWGRKITFEKPEQNFIDIKNVNFTGAIRQKSTVQLVVFCNMDFYYPTQSAFLCK